MPEHPVQRWSPALLVLLGILTAVVSFDRAVRYKFDFHHFHRDAVYVWQNAVLNPDLDNEDLLQRRQLPFYLPVVPLAFSPLGALGQQGAAVAWTLLQIGCLIVCWSMLQRWQLGAGAWFGWLLAIPVLYESARFNQLGLPVLALVLVGTAALPRSRGGLWLAGATVLKLLPGLFLPWLLLKRLWLPGLAAGLGGLLLTLVPCVLVFGPEQTSHYLHEWWHHNVAGAPARGMTDASLKEHFIDHRNQSLPALLARATVADHPHRTNWQPLTLSPDQARRLGLGGLLVLGLVGMWILRRPWRSLASNEQQQEVSLVLLGMLVLGPLLRTYYLVWAIPSLLLLSDRATRGSRAAQFGLAAWGLGLLGWASESARSYGVHWFVLVAVGICLLVSRSAEATEDHGRVVTAEAE